MSSSVTRALVLGLVVLSPRLLEAADIGVLPLAAPQVDASTRAMAQESLLAAVQAIFGGSVEPGELKKRLGPLLRQALECSDSDCWTKVGAKSGVMYMVSARGFGKKGSVLLTVALVRASDGKVVGRAQHPLAVDKPETLSASSEDLIRKLRDSAAASAPEFAPSGAPSQAPSAIVAAEGGDTVVNDQPGDTSGAPVAPLAGMPQTIIAAAKPPEWRPGFGFVEDSEVSARAGTLTVDQGLTFGAMPKVNAMAWRALFGFSLPSFASDVNAPGVSSYRITTAVASVLGDNALGNAPLVWTLALPMPNILLLTAGNTPGARGWMQFMCPLGLGVDWRFLRLGHGLNVGIGPDASLAAGFLSYNATTAGSTYVPPITGLSAEATYGGHLTGSVTLGTTVLTLTGGVQRLANLTHSIGNETNNTLIRVYGAATFARLRLSVRTGGFVFGVDFRERMSDAPQSPTDLASSGKTYAAVAPNPNTTFGKEFGTFIGAAF